MHRYHTMSNQIGFKASDFIMPELFCNDRIILHFMLIVN